MSLFQRLPITVDVAPLLAQLHANPQLWNENPARTQDEASPHHGVPDIWLRTRRPSEFGHSGPYVPEWYRAMRHLPAVRDIVFPLAARFHASMIGNALITRVPAGAEVKGHVDRGWGPEYFGVKAYIVLQGPPDCSNWCETENVTMATGEVWLFTNTRAHGVANRGTQDRLSLIATFRVD
jgi:hypothetical protein